MDLAAEGVAAMTDTLNKKEQDNKNTYIFPKKIANFMSRVSLRGQLEAGMMSMTLLMCGMVLMTVYMIIFSAQTWWQRGMISFNLICGIFLMSTYLITAYQQYKTFMDEMGIDSDAEKKRIKSSGNIFKRIIRAFKQRNQNKKAKKAIENINSLVEKSGVKAEINDELDNEIDDLIKEKSEDEDNANDNLDETTERRLGE